MTGRLLALVTLSIISTAGGTYADTYVVDVGGTGDYTEIQLALDAASTGDTVSVLPGTYTGEDNTILDFDGKDIVLRAAGGTRAVTIDGEGSRYAFYFHDGESPAAIVEGFTVVNGYENSGGAVYCNGSSPSFIDCTFSDCLAEYGGALYLFTASPSFTRCTFSGNTAEGDGYGGCLYSEHCSSVFTDCTFSGNSSVYLGGAIYCYDSGLSLIDCTFSDNSAPTGGGAMYSTDEPIPAPGLHAFSDSEVGGTYPDGGGLHRDRVAPEAVSCTFTGNSSRYGGVVWCLEGSSPTFTDCSFSDNTAFGGGGGAGGVAYSTQSSPVFTNCVMSGNSASSGGAIYSWEGSPSITDCTFSDNSSPDRNGDGGALYLDSTSPAITNCTFSGNWSVRRGGTVHCWQADPVFTNCIIAFGTAGPAIYCEDGSENPVLSCCNLFGNAGGDWVECIEDQSGINGNMSADPLFCDRLEGDFTIDAGSPCAPANSGGCGLVGALDVGCDSPVEATSWGGIKAMYR